jgi:hypothetical protein
LKARPHDEMSGLSPGAVIIFDPRDLPSR